MSVITRLENMLPINMKQHDPAVRGLHSLAFKLRYHDTDVLVPYLASGDLDNYVDLTFNEDSSTATLTFTQVPSSLFCNDGFVEKVDFIRQPFTVDFIATISVKDGTVSTTKGEVSHYFTGENPDLNEIAQLELVGISVWVNNLHDEQAAQSDAGNTEEPVSQD